MRTSLYPTSLADCVSIQISLNLLYTRPSPPHPPRRLLPRSRRALPTHDHTSNPPPLLPTLLLRLTKPAQARFFDLSNIPRYNRPLHLLRPHLPPNLHHHGHRHIPLPERLHLPQVLLDPYLPRRLRASTPSKITPLFQMGNLKADIRG